MNNQRIAIVTGAGQGIGKAIASQLLHDGYAVIIAEKDRQAGREAKKELLSLGSVDFIPTDIRSEKSVRNLFSKIITSYGGLDVLINNAAVFNFKPLNILSLKEWNEVIETNLTGYFLCSKYASPHLKKRKGSIVNIASTRAIQSEPDKEAYAASKGGVIALTHALAVSLGPEVRVNCISPDWIDVTAWKKSSVKNREKIKAQDHKQFPAGRVGQPTDVASLVSFLINPNNSFITGGNFVLDGGLMRKMEYI